MNSFMYRDISKNNKYLKDLSKDYLMDYVSIYNKFIEYFNSTTPKERLKIRYPDDLRLKDDYLYTENHHILPKSLGGTCDSDNMVLLLPEEHIFIHYLRYKTFNTRVDMLAFRFCINGVKGRKNHILSSSYDKSKALNKFIKRAYADLKHNSAKFRLEHGWQTKDGRRRISEARTNTTPVKDSITGEMIGSVSNNHPKVLSGEWVHHTKGTILTQEERDKKACHGEINGKWSGQKEDDFIRYALEYYELFSVIPTWNKLGIYVKLEYDIDLIQSLSKCRFNDGDVYGNKGYIKTMETLTNDKHNGGSIFNKSNITKEIIQEHKNKKEII